MHGRQGLRLRCDGHGGGHSHDIARRGGRREAAAAPIRFVAAKLVLGVAAAVAALREGAFRQQQQVQSSALPSEPKLNHSAPFQCRHLWSVSLPAIPLFKLPRNI